MNASATHTLSLLAPKAMEERLVDLLLEHAPAEGAGFTTRDISGHGAGVRYSDVGEQIRGRVRQVEIVIDGAEADLRGLVIRLRELLGGRGMTYRLCPVTESGEIAGLDPDPSDAATSE